MRIKIGEFLGMIVEKDELQRLSWKQVFVIIQCLLQHGEVSKEMFFYLEPYIMKYFKEIDEF